VLALFDDVLVLDPQGKVVATCRGAGPQRHRRGRPRLFPDRDAHQAGHDHGTAAGPTSQPIVQMVAPVLDSAARWPAS
jgi:hypothetical protein